MATPAEFKSSLPANAQNSTSPTQNTEFPLPASKRPRLSPPLSTTPFPQAQGNYSHISPYANIPSPSPGIASTPPLYSNQNSAIASPRYNHPTLPQSPRFPNTPQSQTAYTTPYSNGNTNATATMNTPSQSTNPKFATSPYPPQNFAPQNTQNHQAQNQFAMQYNQGAQAHANHMAGNMGPPMKPPEKPAAEEDQTDVLTGTGINLREEEAYSQNQFTYNNSASQSTSFSNSVFPPYTTGSEGSFYGSGPASQKAEQTHNKSQEEVERQLQEEAWRTAAFALAQSRQEELANPFSQPKYMMHKMDKIARKKGIRINTSEGSMGRLRVPGQDYEVLTGITTAPTADNQAIMATSGTVLPVDGLVVDQIILLSLAAKQRTRQLLEDAVSVAKGRQVGSSGIVPTEWADIAVPVTGADGTIASVDPDAPRLGWESAVSPRSSPANPLKRKRTESSANRLPTPISDGNKTPVPAKYPLTNELAKALRDAADTERQYEEERLKKRQRRENGTPGAVSAAPGTPGSTASPASAPAPKAPSKKELEKKNKEKKKEDAASNASANATSSMFLKSKKQYSWMKTPGGSAANAASYRGMNATPGVQAAPAEPEAPVELTQRGHIRHGAWREDKSQGEKVQMRDWVAVLEADGRQPKEYHRLMTWLDNPKTKDDEPEAE